MPMFVFKLGLGMSEADEGMRLTIDYTTSGSQCHPCVSPVAECADTKHGTRPVSGSGHWIEDPLPV